MKTIKILTVFCLMFTVWYINGKKVQKIEAQHVVMMPLGTPAPSGVYIYPKPAREDGGAWTTFIPMDRVIRVDDDLKGRETQKEVEASRF